MADVRTRLITPRFAVLTASGLAYFIGWTILYPVLPRFVEEELGGNGLAVGFAVGSFGLTAAALRPLAGRIGDRHGRRVLIVGGMATVAASLLSYTWCNSVALAVVLRLVFGVGEAAAFVGLATAIQDLAPDHRRGEAASYFSLATYGGVAIGPPLGQFVFTRNGYDRVWLAATAVVVTGMVLGAFAPAHRRREPTGAPRRQGWGRLLHPAAVRPGVALGLALIGYGGFVSFAALYADERGIATPGLVFSTYAVLIVVFRLVGAKIPDRFGARRVSSGSALCLAAGLGAMAAIANLAGLFAGLVLFALGMSLNFPALMAVVMSQAREDERSFAVASLSMFFDIGFGLGGPVVGAAVALADSIRVGLAVGALASLSSLLALRRLTPTGGPAVATIG